MVRVPFVPYTDIAQEAGVERMEAEVVVKNHRHRTTPFEGMVKMVERDLRERLAAGLVERVPIEMTKGRGVFEPQTLFTVRAYAMSEATLKRLIDVAYRYGRES